MSDLLPVGGLCFSYADFCVNALVFIYAGGFDLYYFCF